MQQYEIYAIKYAGPFTSSGAFIMWMQNWSDTVERNYYFWVIKNSTTTIVVDAGVSPQIARQRKLVNYVSPDKALKTIDIDANTVEHLVLTHIHWDHAGGLGLFPKASVYVQKKEYQFWMKDPVSKSPAFSFFWDKTLSKHLRDIENSARLKLVDGDQQILPGVECILAPGHSIALQAVGVNTVRGTSILGSDCAHFFKNYQHNWPSALIADMVGWMHSFDKLKEKVSSPELLFPGHDPLMSQNYPEIEKGVTRLV